MSLTFTISPFKGGVSEAQQYAWDNALRGTANYLYNLCGRYAITASGIAATNSGNVIYNPTTGQLLQGISQQRLQYVVCADGSPLTDGITTYTLTDTNIIAGSLDIFIEGLFDYVNIPDQLSHTVIYSPTSIIITWNTGLSCGMKVTFKYWKGSIASNNTSKALQPRIYFTFTSNETSKTFTQLIGVSIDDLGLVFRSGTPVEPVAGTTTDSTQIQYDSSTGTFYPPTGDMFIDQSSLIIEYYA